MTDVPSQSIAAAAPAGSSTPDMLAFGLTGLSTNDICAVTGMGEMAASPGMVIPPAAAVEQFLCTISDMLQNVAADLQRVNIPGLTTLANEVTGGNGFVAPGSNLSPLTPADYNSLSSVTSLPSWLTAIGHTG